MKKFKRMHLEMKSGHLKESQLNFYRQNGYCLVENVVSKEDCRLLIAEANRAAKGKYNLRLNMHQSPKFHKIHIRKDILAMADQLCEHRMIPIGSVFYFSQPNSTFGSSVWHQDNFAPKAPHGSYLVIGLALDDADESNGALTVVPRTNFLGDLPVMSKGYLKKDKTGEISQKYPAGMECKIPEGYEPVQLTYKRGDIIFLHGHIIHRANKNSHPERWRRKIYMHYIKNEHPFWPGWNARRQLIDRED